MRIEDVRVIAVVGAGNMGQQIGVLCAMHGYETYVTDANAAALERARAFAAEYLPGRVAKGRITQAAADRAASLLHFEGNLASAVKAADVVIEAVYESLELKRRIFSEIETSCKSDAVFATNASRIVSSEIAVALKEPTRICNMHFFNPALVMKCVEVMRGPHTSDEAFEVVCQLCQRLGKVPGRIEKELFGMVGSRVGEAIFNTCMEIYAGGYADFETIDSICKNALGHPMGPFELIDLTGIDLSYMECMERYRETGDRAELPWPAVAEKYVKGEWGRKTGKGFYDYKT